MVNKIVIEIPDLNPDDIVEQKAQIAGAYIGASVAATGCAIITGGINLFRGLWAGSQNTFTRGKLEKKRLDNSQAQNKSEEIDNRIPV